jgi:hypothetical protein
MHSPSGFVVIAEDLGKDRRSGNRSISYRVPSDNESDSDDEVTSALLTATISRPDAVEEQRRLLEQQLLTSLEVRRKT